MKLRTLLIGVIGLGVTVLFASRGFSQHEGHDHGDHGHGDDAMMEAWTKAMTPGAHHKHLEPMVGEWNYVSKWRMAPEQPWSEDKGTGKNEWLLDGRYVGQHFKSDAPDPHTGMKFEGHGMLGYDNLKQKHFFMWVDNMGTGLMTGEGTCDDSGKTFTHQSEYMNPMSGKMERARSVTRIINNNKHVFEMYTRDASGKEFASLEVTYTRKN